MLEVKSMSCFPNEQVELWNIEEKTPNNEIVYSIHGMHKSLGYAIRSIQGNIASFRYTFHLFGRLKCAFSGTLNVCPRV